MVGWGGVQRENSARQNHAIVATTVVVYDFLSMLYIGQLTTFVNANSCQLHLQATRPVKCHIFGRVHVIVLAFAVQAAMVWKLPKFFPIRMLEEFAAR
jgi:hypothetical protein